MTRQICNNCGARRGIAVYSNGDYCFSCHKLNKNKSLINIPKIVTTLENIEVSDIFPISSRQWLAEHGIISKHIEKYGIKWSPNYNRIVFYSPNKKFKWLRSMDKNTKHKWLFLGDRDAELFNWTGHSNNHLCIVEDPVSALRVNEFMDSVALGGTNFTSSLLVPLFFNYKVLIVWLDGDKSGTTASKQFRNKFKLLRPIKLIHTVKDPKCYTNKEMEMILND